ncbi:MAG: hypothetical protein WCB74_05960, partial [Pseudolabrys sp.]
MNKQVDDPASHVRSGVTLGHGGMSALSPFSPQLRTLIGAAGTAEKCHFQTHASMTSRPGRQAIALTLNN